MGHFALLDPDPEAESGSIDLIESGSETLVHCYDPMINFSQLCLTASLPEFPPRWS